MRRAVRAILLDQTSHFDSWTMLPAQPGIDADLRRMTANVTVPAAEFSTTRLRDQLDQWRRERLIVNSDFIGAVRPVVVGQITANDAINLSLWVR
jgi:hypothetical protein